MELNEANIIVATHYSISCLSDALVDFLKQKKVKKLCYLRHPLNSNSERPIPLIRVAIKNIYNPIQIDKKWDLFIGINNINAFCGLLLKALGKVDKVVFYTIDFSVERSTNKALNYVYHLVDKICVALCDETWNLSPRMALGRNKYFGIDPQKYNRQFLVPHGAYVSRMLNLRKRLSFDRRKIIFVGTLLEKQGVQKIIKSLPLVIRKLPNVQLDIIGDGPYRKELENLVRALKLDSRVKFLGAVNNEVKEKALSRSALGLATYASKDNFTYFADPGKIRDYLAAGLPIVLTDVPYNAKEIQKEGCGLIVKYNEREIAQAILKILDNKNLEHFQRNVYNYARLFEWESIFTDNIYRILNTDQFRRDLFNKLQFQFAKGAKILDVGCGDGSDCRIFIHRYKLETYGLDNYKNREIRNIRGLKFIKGDVCKLPFPNKYFDYVFIHDVLHHVENPKEALLETCRVVKKGGNVIIIEGNRYNPLFYPHMVLLLKHNHFRQANFQKLILSVFLRTEFKYFEAHVYPSRFRLIWMLYDWFMDNISPKRFLAYNAAIVKT